jgi:hypothetical protein
MPSTASAGSETTRFRFWPARGSRFYTLALLIAVGGVCYVIGVYTASRDLSAARLLIVDLQAETQKERRQILDQNASRSLLEGRLGKVTAELEKIRPSEDTYVFQPNQSFILADGRMTVGLVGPPSTSGIVLNINGSRREASSGDVIPIAVESNTTCRLAVQSFDMFKATITAKCSPDQSRPDNSTAR